MHDMHVKKYREGLYFFAHKLWCQKPLSVDIGTKCHSADNFWC